MTSPGLPLVNQGGINPEPDMWAFQIETPHVSGDSPSIMIDYAHPGTLHDRIIDSNQNVYLIPYFLSISLYRIFALADWDSVFHDESWRRFPKP